MHSETAYLQRQEFLLFLATMPLVKCRRMANPQRKIKHE